MLHDDFVNDLANGSIKKMLPDEGWRTTHYERQQTPIESISLGDPNVPCYH